MVALIDHLPRGRLAIDVSLWSADLGALAMEVRRMTPYADLFHIDVSDTWFIPEPLFFPELVAALRPHTLVPFHVHLMARRAPDLVEPFVRAGADLITIHAEADGVREALHQIRDCGKAAGLALTLETAPEIVAADLDATDAVVMIGSPLGTRGSSMHPTAPGRIAALRRMLAAGGAQGRRGVRQWRDPRRHGARAGRRGSRRRGRWITAPRQRRPGSDQRMAAQPRPRHLRVLSGRISVSGATVAAPLRDWMISVAERTTALPEWSISPAGELIVGDVTRAGTPIRQVSAPGWARDMLEPKGLAAFHQRAADTELAQFLRQALIHSPQPRIQRAAATAETSPCPLA